MTLYIIRHGETEMNRLGIVQGSGVDAELNTAGQEQARRFFNHYAHVEFDFVLTSALKRTYQTVSPLVQSNKWKGREQAWLQFPELNEISWGIHEGHKSSPLLKEAYSKVMTDWEKGVYTTKLEGGESAAELHARVSKVLNMLKQETFFQKNVLLCTHGRTLLCMLTILKNMPLSKMNTFRHHNTCLYKAHYKGDDFVFEIENDISHLDNKVR